MTAPADEPIFVGIGANLGDARATVEAAFDALDRLPRTRCVARSSLWASAPVDAEGPDYVNAVAELRSALEPEALLAELLALELRFGRERPGRNAPRSLDLDLLHYGARRIASATLTLPHPRAHLRAFVALPLRELAATLVPQVPEGQRIERIAP